MNNNVHRKNGTQKTCKYENPVILQVDGNNSSVNSAHPYITPANLSPVSGQDVVHGQPLIFEVNDTDENRSSFLPLCLVMNCRSVCNKADNLKEIMHCICPDIILASETWERERMRLSDVLKTGNLNMILTVEKIDHPEVGVL